MILKLKPSEKFGSDRAQKAQTTVEQVGCDTVEFQWSMGRVRGILMNIQQLSCILIGCIFYGKVKYTHIYIIDQGQGQGGSILAKFSFCVFMDQHKITAHKDAKEWGQYPAILTELAWWIKDLLSCLNNIEKMNFVLAYFRALKRKPVTCKIDGAPWFSCFLVPSWQRKDRKPFYCLGKYFAKKTFVNQFILQQNVIMETKLKMPSGQYDTSSCPLGKQITAWGLFHFASSQSMPYNKSVSYTHLTLPTKLEV